LEKVRLMARWIVFMTVGHHETFFFQGMPREDERLVITRPLLAAPTKAIAELVAARLNYQHGLQEEVGTDDWQEFSFKDESGLTPHEVAMVLDLNDPAYPTGRRHASWLAEMVASAKVAMKDVAGRAPKAPARDEGAYLFAGAGSSAVASTSTVFHLAGSMETAESLRSLFTKEYAPNGVPTSFHAHPAGTMSPEQRVLLNEAIDDLAMYDDPDPGIYDPPPSKSALARAEYARRASRWEAMLGNGTTTRRADSNGTADASEVLVFVADSTIHFGDSRRVLPSNGAVVASISSRALAEAVLDMYQVERGPDALPLVLVDRAALSVTQVALAMRELSRAEAIGANLGSDEYSTNDPTFARICGCAVDLVRLAEELEPMVSKHEAQNGRAPGRQSTTSVGSRKIVERVDALLRAVERHRLMFLYWAAACRRNPLATRSRTGINERVLLDEIRGWKEMVDAIDSDGTFLWTHRDVLNRYAQAAVEQFGPGEGMRPAEPDEKGRGVPVEGGTHPYWSLDEGSTSYMEQSSDAILDASRALAEAGEARQALDLVREATGIARPDSHPRWYTSVVVKWAYLAGLDSLITRIKTVRVELAMPRGSGKASSTAPEGSTPDPQNVADLVVLFMLTRDLLRIGRDYPDALPEAEQEAWLDEVTAHSNLILERTGFQGIKTLMKEPTLLEMGTPERFGILMSTTMLSHPAMAAPAGTAAEIQAAVEKAMHACQESASPRIKEMMSRLANVMVVSCRCPTGAAVKDFADPARHLQMLRRYWMLASELVQIQATCHVGFNPHPLLHLIENIRDRLQTCFSHVSHLADAGEAEHASDQLVGMLTEGDIDDLSAVPEWTNGELQKVERFIACARLKVGPREFPLTSAEEFFIKQCEHLIAEHSKRVKTAWKQMLAKVDAQAAVFKRAAPKRVATPAPVVDPKQAPVPPAGPAVVIGRHGDPCTVCGKMKPALTDGQHAVVAALIDAGDKGLKKDAIEAIRSSARRMLEDLRKDSDWAAVIQMPGRTNVRYRIRM